MWHNPYQDKAERDKILTDVLEGATATGQIAVLSTVPLEDCDGKICVYPNGDLQHIVWKIREN